MKANAIIVYYDNSLLFCSSQKRLLTFVFYHYLTDIIFCQLQVVSTADTE